MQGPMMMLEVEPTKGATNCKQRNDCGLEPVKHRDAL
jgi:hypothetical protein